MGITAWCTPLRTPTRRHALPEKKQAGSPGIGYPRGSPTQSTKASPADKWEAGHAPPVAASGHGAKGAPVGPPRVGMGYRCQGAASPARVAGWRCPETAGGSVVLAPNKTTYIRVTDLPERTCRSR